ncbi:MAG: DUF3237 domain-containing protein [Henriciella sp.]|nr:DUF3237 domain-containing protein [Henriciella sp.]
MSDMVKPLKHQHLLTLRLNVGADKSAQIGVTPTGRRSIVPVHGGTFEGERLSGEVLPGGADWVLFRADGVMQIDVRLTLKTGDGAMIYLTYQGRFVGDARALADLAQGKVLAPERYSLATVAKFETGDERYFWLNNVIAVGTGEQSGFNPIYTIYEIG